jgi:hypothetical protein
MCCFFLSSSPLFVDEQGVGLGAGQGGGAGGGGGGGRGGKKLDITALWCQQFVPKATFFVFGYLK